jgi:SAM-dependent methyltransferase
MPGTQYWRIAAFLEKRMDFARDERFLNRIADLRGDRRCRFTLSPAPSTPRVNCADKPARFGPHHGAVRMDTLSLILETFAPIDGRRILDIGCGPGVLAGALAGRGATVTGIDPGEAAIRDARARVPAARFELASAEALPFADASFDGAVMLNALHHVPDPAAALSEAARVVGPGRVVVIVEPLAEGSSFAALRPIEDETAIRAAAQAAIAAALGSGVFTCTRDVTYERHEIVPDLAGFLERATAVDPARRAAIEADPAGIRAAFEAAAARVEGGYGLTQPLRAQVLIPVG